jgi:hypothetical protein
MPCEHDKQSGIEVAPESTADRPLDIPEATPVEVALEKAGELHGRASMIAGAALAKSGRRRAGRPPGRKSGGNSKASTTVAVSYVSRAEVQEDLLRSTRTVIFDLQQQIATRSVEIAEMQALIGQLEKRYFDRAGDEVKP